MQPNMILRWLIESRGLSQRNASVKFGRSPSYVSRILAGGYSPTTAVLAEFCSILDYDLIIRDRTNGAEVTIDPPENPE